MSGGKWNYQDARELDALIDEDRTKKFLAVLRLCWHVVDWAESGDSSREEAAIEVYEVLRASGEAIFGDLPFSVSGIRAAAYAHATDPETLIRHAMSHVARLAFLAQRQSLAG